MSRYKPAKINAQQLYKHCCITLYKWKHKWDGRKHVSKQNWIVKQVFEFIIAYNQENKQKRGSYKDVCPALIKVIWCSVIAITHKIYCHLYFYFLIILTQTQQAIIIRIVSCFRCVRCVSKLTTSARLVQLYHATCSLPIDLHQINWEVSIEM